MLGQPHLLRQATGVGRPGAADPNREAAARATGQFFRRCLNGEPRGESGRGRVPLQNRIFVLIRSFEGVVHTHPVRVYSSYSALKPHICETGTHNNFGDSIFAGFASQWEASLAVREAGCDWPAEIL